MITTTTTSPASSARQIRAALATLSSYPPAVLGAALVQLGDHRPHGDPSVLAVLLAAEQLVARLPHPNDDVIGGRYHRSADLDARGVLARHRYPPTGDRDLWIAYGPDGPPATVHPLTPRNSHRTAHRHDHRHDHRHEEPRTA